jgi:hypothetical protein
MGLGALNPLATPPRAPNHSKIRPPGVDPVDGIERRRKSEDNGFAEPASRQSRPRSWRGILSNRIDADQREAR